MKWNLAALILLPLLLVGRASARSGAVQRGAKSKATTKAAVKSTKSSTVHSKGRGTTKKARRSSGPSYQTHPSSERYAEIQQSLADKGYYKGTVNGVWGEDSVDALKRFQADNKLPDDGKINSLSLIQLGLGPKHDGTTAASAPAGVTSGTPSVTAPADAAPNPPRTSE